MKHESHDVQEPARTDIAEGLCSVFYFVGINFFDLTKDTMFFPR